MIIDDETIEDLENKITEAELGILDFGNSKFDLGYIKGLREAIAIIKANMREVK